MILKAKMIMAGMIFLMSTCQNKVSYDDMYGACDTSYQISDTYFSESSDLTFRLRFVYFADSLNEPQPDYNKTIDRINAFYGVAGFVFKKHKVDTVVSSDIKEDMPSYVKYHFKNFRNDSVITCYIYGNYQPNYSEDRKFTVGSAGGIGSKFFAVRRMFLDSITTVHEIGHCFSLLHTSIPSSSHTPYTIYDSDLVCDTRAIDNLDNKVDEDCNFTGEEKLTKEEQYSTACNYMSRSYMKCRHCITNGQIRRMRFYIHESPDARMTISSGLKKELF